MPEYFEKEILKTWVKEFITTNPLFLKALDYTPSADVEPVRHGHWEADVCYRVSPIGKLETRAYYKCSICKTVGDQTMKYCHNCGAKMDEENSECVFQPWKNWENDPKLLTKTTCGAWEAWEAKK